MSANNPAASPPQSAGIVPASDLIRRELPPLAARGLALFLIALFAAAVTITIYVRFPETVRASFVLVPERGANPITSPRRGIVATVNVEDAKEIKAGDLLYVIRSDELRLIATEKAGLEKEASSTSERLRELENETRARAAVDETSRVEYEAKIKRLMEDQRESELKDAELEKRYKVALANIRDRITSTTKEVETERKRLELIKVLKDKAESNYRNGIITEVELLRERYQYQLADVELVQSDRRNTEATAALSELDTARSLELRERSHDRLKLAGEIAEIRTALARLVKESEARDILAQDRSRLMKAAVQKSEIQIASMARELEGAEDGLLRVTAPYSGTVVRLGTQRIGEVIERGTVLCEMAAAGEKLIAEIAIPEKDAGLVAKGQKIKMLYSAYPYTRFGARRGTLSWLSPTTSAKGVFRGIAQLDDSGVMVKGSERTFSAGMTGEARILAGERTLIEFVLEPLNQLKENMAKN